MYKNLISVVLLLITTSFATSQAQEVYWKKQVVSVPVNASANKSVFNQMFQLKPIWFWNKTDSVSNYKIQQFQLGELA